MEPSANTAKPGLETVEPKPEYGDSAFSSKPGQMQPSADYGEERLLAALGFELSQQNPRRGAVDSREAVSEL